MKTTGFRININKQTKKPTSTIINRERVREEKRTKYLIICITCYNTRMQLTFTLQHARTHVAHTHTHTHTHTLDLQTLCRL